MRYAATLGLIATGLTVVGGLGATAKWAHDAHYDDRYILASAYEAGQIRAEIRTKQDKIDEVEVNEQLSDQQKQQRIKKLERQIEGRQRELDRMSK